MGLKYNKGEWSEFYVFLHVLATGKLYAADGDLKKIPQIYYNILAAIKNDIKYERDTLSNSIIFNYGGKSISIPIDKFIDLESKVINKIMTSSGTFEINETDKPLKELKIDSIKEKSATKGDIILQIHDDFTGFEPTLSFSIKSYLGSNPTLLNASNGTVVTFKLINNLSKNNITDINNMQGSSKVKDRIKKIRDLGTDLKYHDIPSEIFKENLQMIDYRMPEIISEIYLESYFVKGKRMVDVVNSYLARNPNEKSNIIEYKVKEFLVAVALGMVPMTNWSGLDEANGGYIVVKEDAEIVCYHIYDRNRLKDYLYKYTKFDTPSMSRYSKHQAGLVQSKDNEQLFNLVMQVRF